MKFLAVLRDSFREAVDVRVFYLVVAMSVGLLLTFASLTVTPRPARELAVGDTRLVLEGPLSTGQPPRGAFLMGLQSAEPQGGAPDRPDSPVRFTVVVQYFHPDGAARARHDPGPVADLIRRRFGRFEDRAAFAVTDVQLVPPAEARGADRQVQFWVLTRPTADTLRLWPCDTSLLFGAAPLSSLWQVARRSAGARPTGPDQGEDEAPPLGVQVFTFLDLLVSGLSSWGIILVSIVATAFFVPSMLHKGTLEMLLVKPLARWRLLVYKYLGGLVFIALNAAFAVVGVWLVLGLRCGIWCHPVLLLIPMLTFLFAVLYAVSVLVSVLTHSPVVTMLITCVAWALLYGLGLAYGSVHEPGAGQPDAALVEAVDALHAVLPRTRDLGKLTRQVLERDLSPEVGEEPVPPEGAPAWAPSLGVSTAFITVLLGLACVRFGTRDY